MGLLSDAESCLRLSDPVHLRAELGMVELHRAQARLWSAEDIIVCTRKHQENHKELKLSQLCNLFETFETEPPQRSTMLNRLKELKDCPGSRHKSKALVADAVHFLNRAEPMLRERRRNVWLAMWYFEGYRLVCLDKYF